MPDLEAFERSCRDASRQLRRLPREVKQALAVEATARVATPIAAEIARKYRGPWAEHVRPTIKARKAADPTIAIGARRKVLRGGGSTSDVVYGAEWGGGKRPTTQQFKRNRTPGIIPVIRAQGAWMIDQVADITLETMERMGLIDGQR